AAGEPPRVEIEPLVRAMGFERVFTVDPYNLHQVEETLRERIAAAASPDARPSVVISRRECALLPEVRRGYRPLRIDEDKCLACGACRRVGCPAVVKSDAIYAKTGRNKSAIDPLLCTGCEICAQVCTV